MRTITVQPDYATRHEDRQLPEYAAWRAMLHRCTNPNNPAYSDYGGRGITVCERWLSFYAFLADMGKRPAANLSLDRIDNDGSYEPNNCRWATHSQQSINRRRRVTTEQREAIRARYAAGGVTQWQLGCEYGLSHTTISNVLKVG